MVAYGSSLRRARRPGWEDAYLDYDCLKRLLKEMASLYKDVGTKQNSQSHSDDDNYALQEADRRAVVLGLRFLTVLRAEIEKVSLFALSRQGELADAVGALRFGHTAGTVVMRSSVRSNQNGTVIPSSNGTHQDNDTDSFDGFEMFGEHAALLPRAASSTSLQLMVESHNSTVRPMFRGNEQLLCTVHDDDGSPRHEKLDAFTSLGVEMLHLLRYICVNAVGIRKILKKHDKLFATQTRLQELDYGFDYDEFVMSASPGSNMLVGGADDHVQQLANSASIAAISASLGSVFVSYESKQLLSSGLYSKDDGIGYEASLSNDSLSLLEVGGLTGGAGCSPSLVRFQCAITSVETLREYAQIVNQPFRVFLSRKAMIATGTNLGGLEGSTLQALEIMLRFQPDSILTMDEDALKEWQERMLNQSKRSTRTKSRGASFDDTDIEFDGESWGGVNSVSLAINLMSTLLYTVNYYIVAPTANHYAILLGTDGAFGSTLIGASSFAALFAAFLYSVWYTRASFRSALLFSSACPCVGNLLYAFAISYGSMKVAIWGRILVGMGSAEVVNRQLISACVSFQSMTKASAFFVAAGALGMSVGPLLAGILDMVSGRDLKVDIEIPGLPEGGIIYNHVTSPGFVMALLWFLEMLALVFLFSEPDRINGGGFQGSSTNHFAHSSRSSDDADVSDQSEEGGQINGIEITTYGSVSTPFDSKATTLKTKLPPRGASQIIVAKWRRLASQMTTIRKLICGNMALPVTLLLFAFIELADEVLISSCSMVCRRYFGWHGSRAGFLIASLGALVLPAHLVVERASRFYEEREIMKHSIVFICVSLLAILNYTGILYDTVGLGVETVETIESGNTDDSIESPGEITEAIASFTNDHNEFPYDWGGGKVVYMTFLSAVFMGTIILEGVDTSLMAKVTPAALNDTFINSGLLATLVGTLGRVCGDSMITVSAIVDKRIFTDFVNATFIPMIPLTLIGYWLVKRYYNLLT